MDPRIEQLIDRLSSTRRDLKAAVESVPPARRSVPPAPDRWSVAQVLEHLSIVEGSLSRRIEELLAKAGPRPPGETFDPDTFRAGTELPTVLDRSRRRTAPTAAQPSGALDHGAALRRLEESRPRLLAIVQRGADLALEHVVQPHPALGELTLYQWIAFVAGHEARHAAQIREIGQELKGPSA